MELLRRENSRPRRMFPPPTTIASCTPAATTRLICSEAVLTAAMLMPLSPGRQNPSPESFSSTRRYAGTNGATVEGSDPCDIFTRWIRFQDAGFGLSVVADAVKRQARLRRLASGLPL